MTRSRICSPLRTVLSAWLAMPPLSGATFTLVLSPVLLAALLLAALLISTVVTFIVVFDGKSTWFEGATLIGLHILLATCFWWGWPARRRRSPACHSTWAAIPEPGSAPVPVWTMSTGAVAT